MKELVILDLKIVLNEDFSYKVISKGYSGCKDLVTDFSESFVDIVLEDYINYSSIT